MGLRRTNVARCGALPGLTQARTTGHFCSTSFLLDRSLPVGAVTLPDTTAQDSAQPLHSDRTAIGTRRSPDYQTTSLWRMEKCPSQPLGGALARSRACNG